MRIWKHFFLTVPISTQSNSDSRVILRMDDLIKWKEGIDHTQFISVPFKNQEVIFNYAIIEVLHSNFCGARAVVFFQQDLMSDDDVVFICDLENLSVQQTIAIPKSKIINFIIDNRDVMYEEEAFF